MRRIFLIFIILLSFVLSNLGFAAVPSLDDGAKLLEASERIVLQKELERVEKAHGIRCVVVTRQAIGGAVPGEYANKLNKTIYNDAPNGAILFLQVTDVRKWYISIYGNARSAVVGNEGVEYMSKQVVPYLKENEHMNAYMTFAKRADELMQYKKEHSVAWKPAEFGDDVEDWGIAGGIILAVSTFISVWWTRKRNKSRVKDMSNVHFSKAADSYLDESSFRLKNEWNQYLYSTTVVHTEPDRDDDDSYDGSVSDSSSDGDCDGGGGDY